MKNTNSQILNYSTLTPTNYELKDDKIISLKENLVKQQN